MSYTQLVRLDRTVKAELDDIGKKKETYSDILFKLKYHDYLSKIEPGKLLLR